MVSTAPGLTCDCLGTLSSSSVDARSLYVTAYNVNIRDHFLLWDRNTEHRSFSRGHKSSDIAYLPTIHDGSPYLFQHPILYSQVDVPNDA